MIDHQDQVFFFDHIAAQDVLSFFFQISPGIHNPASEWRDGDKQMWDGIGVANSSPYEEGIITLWLEANTDHHGLYPRARRTGKYIISCLDVASESCTDFTASARHFYFKFYRDLVEFKQMIEGMPQRVHVAKMGTCSRFPEDIEMIFTKLNHTRWELLGGDHIVTFADTPYADQIKTLAAMSQGF